MACICRGTEPFLATDPTRERNCFEKYFSAYLNPLILTFGIYANWTAHLVEVRLGGNTVSVFLCAFCIHAFKHEIVRCNAR